MITILDLKDTKLVGVNEKYINRQYFLTPAYRKQKETWSWIMRAALPKRWDKQKPTSVTITLSCYRDLDAVIKPVLDAGTVAGVWEDDRQITQLVVFKNAIKRGSKESITVEVD